MHSHEHLWIWFCFDDRLEHFCLEELRLITCLLGSLYANVVALNMIWWDGVRWMLGGWNVW